VNKTGQIRNKQKRQQVYAKVKAEKAKQRKEQRLKRKRDAQALGEDAPPKQIPKTLDNTREHDKTIVQVGDDEVQREEEEDEFVQYFNNERTPKIMLTTRPRPSRHLFPFMSDLMTMMPNTFFYKRKSYDIRDMAKWAYNKKFTHLVVLGQNKKNKECNQMLICHLPQGPTALLKISSVKHSKSIKGHGSSSFHLPEIILNRFSTRLGHRVGRLLGSMYSHNPEFHGRNVVTFHNQRDFIFVRHHRYIFADKYTKTRLQELGPRFTMKPKWIMAGSFDPQHGEYEWILKRKEMETSKRKFFL